MESNLSKVNFGTERMNLYEVQLIDLENIHALHSMHETDRFNTLGIPGSITETEKLLSGWIEAQNEIPRKKYVLFIENKVGHFMGLLGINIGRPEYRKAEIWYKLHPEYWNMGYATEALKGCIDFCFRELKLHRIEAGCAVANIASVKVMEKAGMIREGIERKNLPIRGEWLDNYTYSILEDEFFKPENITPK